MPTRKFPHVIGGRVNEKELATVDAAARLERVPRAQFVRSSVLDAARRRIVEEAGVVTTGAENGQPSA